jgi:peptide/nickel transport system substrate-binding protein
MVARVALLIAVLALCLVSVKAQEPLGPGEGKPVSYPDAEINFITSNPLLMSVGGAGNLVWLLYPTFIGTDANTGLPQPRAIGSIATGWTLSDDNRTLTVTLRDDWTWSDGTPITSADVKYGYDAAASGQMESPLNSWILPLESLEAPDDRTVVLTAREPDCGLLNLAVGLPVVPAHHFRAIFPTFTDITTEHPENLAPSVTAGPFRFGSFQSGQHIVLPADQNFPDSPAGHVVSAALIVKFVSSQLVAYEQFLDGQITTMFAPEDRVDDAKARAAAGEIGIVPRPDSGYGIMLFNTADPTNPQPAIDEAGNPVEQPPHPILGALHVRRAIAHAIDFDALNLAGMSGQGIPVGGIMLPHSWAYNPDIHPYPYDLDLARSLLDQAGWVDQDGSDATPRVATAAVGTVPAGTPLELSIMVDANYSTSIAVATLMQDQFRRIGVRLEIEAVDLNVLASSLFGQTFDLANFYWWQDQAQPQQMGQLVGSESDIPGSGFNWMSYSNPEVDALLAQARTVPGCGQDERKALYDRVQQIVHDDVPVYIINTSTLQIVYQRNVENFEPRPFGEFWNVSALGVR